MIKKQLFPRSFIAKNARSAQDLADGYDLLNEGGALRGPLGEEKTKSIHYLVWDKKKLNVKLSFYDNGIIKSYACNCERADQDGLCAHVVACLLHLNEVESEDIPVDKKNLEEVEEAEIRGHQLNERAIEGWFDQYNYPLLSMDNQSGQQTVQFQFKLQLLGNERIPFYLLTMKVGVDFMYVVSDMEEIAYKFLNRIPHSFGKQFDYDPSFHILKEEDINMLELLQGIMDQNQYFLSSTKARRELRIPSQWLKPVLSQMMRLDGSMIQNSLDMGKELDTSDTFDVDVYEKPVRLPISLTLSSPEPAYYTLTVEEGTWERLCYFREANVLLFRTTFYFLTIQQSRHVKPLLKTFRQIDGQALWMNQEEFDYFLKQVLASLQRTFKIEVDPALQHRFISPELEAQLYVDWREGSLWVRPVFKYLNQSFYPLEAERQAKVNPDQVVLRRYEEEAEKMQAFENALQDFDIEGGMAYSDRLSYIARFLYEDLDVLSDHFTIMMTQSAQDIMDDSTDPVNIHIDLSTSNRYLDIRFELEDMDEKEFRDIARALQSNHHYYEMSDGKLLNLKNKAYSQMQGLLEKLDLSADQLEEETNLPFFKSLILMEEDLNKSESAGVLKTGQALKSALKDLKNPSELAFSLPDSLQANLRNYQEEGFKWLKTMDYYGFGAVLADDMGLGKTVQTIAFIASKLEEDKGPFLIVCPASVLYNWEHEFKKFTPSLSTQVIAGDPKERQEKLQEAIDQDIPIWLTTYPLLQRDEDLYRDIVFSNLILDEAQYVKNMNTKTAQSVRQLKRDQVVALSGTPIENRLGELYSLFSIVMPGLFDSLRHFQSLTLEQISQKTRPFILRRMKSDVLSDLPEKTESVEHIDLSKDQKVIYQTQIDLLRDDVQGYLEENSLSSHRMSVLSGLTRLRQICNDPRLVVDGYEGESAKLTRLLEILEEAKENGKRVVLFSQFTQMLALIREELDQLGYDYHYLDGSTPTKERLDLAQAFNTGEKDLFLISLKAGGTGINLTGGDTVILYDSWWNPAVEDQAADRVHRFGQKKNVQVIRMISKGTIEERIYDLQEEKRDLIHSVIDSSGDAKISSITTEELVALIDM